MKAKKKATKGKKVTIRDLKPRKAEAVKGGTEKGSVGGKPKMGWD